MEPETLHVAWHTLRRVRLDVAYHGAAFHGFAENSGVDTVAGRLVDAIERITGTRPNISTAGRTDAGVHARGQVVSFDLVGDTDLDDLIRGVNALCGPHIVARDGAWVGPEFDARASATWRHYKYVVLNTARPDPMLTDRAWHVRGPMSVPLMNLACDAIIGEQDFSAFCRKPPREPGSPEASLKRYVMVAGWSDNHDGTLTFDIRANAFCHQMVRSLTGFLVDVGLGRRPPSDTRRVLLAADRAHGSRVAPAHGLTLWEVGYDGRRIHPQIGPDRRL